jgi:hypothetical protein
MRILCCAKLSDAVGRCEEHANSLFFQGARFPTVRQEQPRPLPHDSIIIAYRGEPSARMHYRHPLTFNMAHHDQLAISCTLQSALSEPG